MNYRHQANPSLLFDIQLKTAGKIITKIVILTKDSPVTVPEAWKIHIPYFYKD